MKTLLDILACPVCQTHLLLRDDGLVCSQGHRFPVVDGVPVLLPDANLHNVQYEAPLAVREGYDPWIHRNVLQSLMDSQVVLDIGAGNVVLDDPCIIRSDVTLTPYVDIVADAHALPFLDESIDYIISLAVLEHLHRPFVAAQEMYRVLKRGGYVYADTNFVFTYHGYPHHYFNFTLNGIEQVFSDFTKLRSGVPPYQMPSYAIENLLSTYLKYFEPGNQQEMEFIQVVQQVLDHPLRSYDAKFTQDIAYRFSAGVFFLGFKQVSSDDSLIPRPIRDAYLQNENLRARFPNPNDLTSLDNLMMWARREGREIYPTIAELGESCQTFSKHWDENHPLAREWIRSLPLEEMSQPQVTIVCDVPAPTLWWQLPGKAWRVLIGSGPKALVINIWNYARWLFGRFL